MLQRKSQAEIYKQQATGKCMGSEATISDLMRCASKLNLACGMRTRVQMQTLLMSLSDNPASKLLVHSCLYKMWGAAGLHGSTAPDMGLPLTCSAQKGAIIQSAAER
jgi:hypothetical protein